MDTLNLSKYRLFTLFGLFWVGLGWLGIVLTLLGFFHIWILSAYLALAGIILALLAIKNRTNFNISWRFCSIFLVSLSAVTLFSCYTTPTIFSGRDQGSFSEAAIRLSQNRQLKFSTPASQEFFKIYGTGKALNFPGFNYTQDGKLTTQFSLGYVSWLAIFYSFLGLQGLILANTTAFLIFLLSFYLLSRLCLRTSSAIMGHLLILTSFVFSWFFKFTLSENLALALTWFGIVEFVLFIKREKRFYLWASMFTFFLLAFIRLEAFAFILTLILILLVKYRSLKTVVFEIMGKSMFVALFFASTIYAWNIAENISYYISSLKGLVNSFPFLKSETTIASTGSFLSSIYVMKVFSAYALIDFLILSLAAFIILIGRAKFETLIPFFIVLPTFIFLVHPGISLDHPWMLRRFAFSIIPASILYSIIFLDKLFKKRFLFYGASLLLLAFNLMVFIPYFKFSENKTLLSQIENISGNFKDSDLILVDRLATGNGWAMMSGPMNFLYGKQAVYFFNPYDLVKLDLKKFDRVYFIIPDNGLDLYVKSGLYPRLEPQKDYKIQTSSLNVVSVNKEELHRSQISLPEEKAKMVYGKIYKLKE